MLRTVLLLDGSESINSSSDYLPSYLLALRPPLMQFISEYLDSTPLATLGAVVMRDSISRRLCSCTTSANEMVEKLERDYFLYGGSGATSLENGLRMTLSELVDLQKFAEKRPGADASSSPSRRRRPQAVQLRVLLITASVTLIDPTDIFRVIATFRKFHIQIDVITFHGAVHVYDMCARQTGGQLYCPLRFDHLLRILHQLAVNGGYTEDAERSGHRPQLGYILHLAPHGRAAAVNKGNPSEVGWKSPPPPKGGVESDSIAMVPIGFPIFLERPVKEGVETYLACPQCHFIQTTIPATCPLCKLLLCNVGMLFSTFVAHNRLVPPYRRLPQELPRLGPGEGPDGEENEEKEGEINEKAGKREGDVRCHLCADVVGQAGEDGWVCESCAGVRCGPCQMFVVETLGLCPSCIALQ
ncbi:unnamed protein product [Phytomonas sp. Hart1]|nr:unnamed protein product [Phytomonas sp. Hart1]|eukprot:CCW65963.1 unnamed protein product [Phytomonas sp. isolate Hart1]